jgi:small multidrug resistance pump
VSWLLLAGAIGTEIAGTMFLRASDGLRRRRWIAPVGVAYVAAFTCLGFALAAGMPVGLAYGVWSAVGVALTAVLGRVLFRDPLTWVMGLGIVLVAGGVLLIDLGATRS